MSKIRNGHVLRLEDGHYYIEEAPFTTPKLDEAELYFKYFDLMEAQARAARNTQMEAHMIAVSFVVSKITEK